MNMHSTKFRTRWLLLVCMIGTLTLTAGARTTDAAWPASPGAGGIVVSDTLGLQEDYRVGPEISVKAYPVTQAQQRLQDEMIVMAMRDQHVIDTCRQIGKRQPVDSRLPGRDGDEGIGQDSDIFAFE